VGNTSVASTSSDNVVTFGATPRPDLISILTVVSGSTAKRGQSVSLAEVTLNIGTAAALSSMTRVYLSPDPTVDPADLELGVRNIGNLSPRAFSVGSLTVVIPRDASPGTYYLISVADSGGTVIESNELNNTSAQALRVR
jgi:hypothetical protein